MPSRWSSRAAALALVSLIAILAGACADSPEVKKQKAVEKAEAYLKDGKVNEAVIELRNALQIDRDYVPALHALGRAYAAKSWYPDASRELARAHVLAPDSIPIAADLGRMHIETGSTKEAETVADTILAREPNNATGLFVRAAALLMQRRMDEATGLINQVGQSGQTFPELQSLRAEVLYAGGKTDEAEQAYKAVLAGNPKDLRSLNGLGAIALSRNQLDEAAGYFNKAKTLKPMDPRARAGVAAVLERQGRLAEATTELESMEPRARTGALNLVLADYYLRANRPIDVIRIAAPMVERLPRLTQARYLVAMAYLSKGDVDRAIGEFEELSRQAPGNPAIELRLASAYLRRGRAPEALARFDRLLKTPEQDKNPELHLERGRALLAMNRLDAAGDAAAVAVRLAPQRAAGYLLLGQIRTQQGNTKAAREMFAKAAEVDPASAQAHLALGRLNVSDNDTDAALKEFDAAVKADPRSLAAARVKATALVQQGKPQEAIEFVESAIKSDPRNPGFHALLGALYLRGGDWAKAQTSYGKVLELDPRSVGARLGLSRVAMAQAKDDEAMNHLQAALKERPDHGAAVALYAGLANKLGRASQALPVLEAAVKANPKHAVFAVMLGDIYLQNGRYEDVIRVTSTALGHGPAHPGMYLLRGRAHLGRYDPRAALKDFTAAGQADPKSAEARYYQGRAHATLGQPAEAQAAYKEALRIAPAMEPAKVELAALTGKRPQGEEWKQNVAKLREAVAKAPSSVPLREQLVRALVDGRDNQGARTEVKALLERAPSHPEGNFLMAQFLVIDRKPDEAATHLRATLRGNPQHMEANVILARYLESKGRREEAIPLLETALRVNPQLQDVKLQLAGLYAQTNRLGEATRYAQELRTALPKHPGPHLLTGWISLGQGNPRAARDAFKTALSMSASLPGANRGLGRALEELGETDAAIEQYRKALSVNPQDPVSMNNLAWLLLETRQKPDEALPLATRALQVSPRSASVLDTLGWIHYRRGDYAEAEKALSQAAERAPRAAAIQFHLGMTYFRLGKKTEAVTALQRAARLDAKLAQAEQIDRLIREIGG